MSNPTYNPGPGPYPTAPPPPPPKKRRTGLIVLIVVGVIVIAFIGSCAAVMGAISNAANEALQSEAPVVVEEDQSEAPAEEKKESKPAEKESDPAEEKKEQEPYTIKATECTRGDFGQVDIKVKVTNHTDKKSNYIFDISVEDTDGNVVGTGFGSIDNVRSGKTGTASTFASLTDEEYEGKLKCVIEVTDYADF